MNTIMWAFTDVCGAMKVCGAMNIINDWGGVRTDRAEGKARPHQRRVGGA